MIFLAGSSAFRIIIAAGLALALNLPALALPAEIVVDLFQARGPLKTVTVGRAIEILEPRRQLLPPGRYAVIAEHHRLHFRQTSAVLREARSALISADRFVIKDCSGTIEVQSPGAEMRLYRGTLIIEQGGNNTIKLRNRVATRDYVKSVVGSETNPDFPFEELKAQAVMAQTLLARYKPGDWLADTTEKQAYLGATYERVAGASAVDQVWGQILVYKKLPAQLYFHSTCAGGTSSGEQYFQLKSGAYPYLDGTECHFCRQSPFWKPTITTIPQADFTRAMGAPVPIITLKDIRERPLQARQGERTLNGYRLWLAIGQKLGWDKMPGTRYAINANDQGGVKLTSTGAGHGIGLCQWGAAEMAHEGKSYRQILNYYFPGTHIQKTK